MTKASRSITSLAIFGGSPAFSRPLHVGKPNIGNRKDFLRRVGEALDRQWLTNGGPLLEEFEGRIADLLGVSHCVGVCNGTMALAIAAKAAGLENEVIVPSFTFVATAHALEWQGISPVFCDVDIRTHHLDPAAVEASITSRTAGILGVHTWGRACDVEALIAIGRRYDLPILFDAAPAFGCSYKGSMIGSFGAAEALSFHATKMVNAIEGGAIVTNSDEIAERARLMRNYGFVANGSVVSLGTNAKMSELSAAMGITSLESLDSFRETNLRNYRWYQEGLAGIPAIRLLEYDVTEQNSYHNIVLEVDEAACGMNRDLLLRVLVAENVLARRYFFPGCHKMEPYRSQPENRRKRLPNTELIAARVLSLPTGTQVGKEDIDTICRIVGNAIARGAEISKRVELHSSVQQTGSYFVP